MASPLSLIAPAVSLGTSVFGGLLGAKGAGVKAQGDQLAIHGQMLATMGKAFQFDVESQQFMWKSGIEKYQAAVAKINRDIAMENAIYERDKGEVEAQQLGMKQRFALGQLVASQGASGIDVGSGSFARIREGMIDVGYHDQAMTRANSARRAYGFEVQATQYEAQAGVHSMTADLDKAQAENATIAAGITRQALPLMQQAQRLTGTVGTINAMTSLTGAAGSVASKWMSGEFKGMFGDRAVTEG